jgi:hypothetical protein
MRTCVVAKLAAMTIALLSVLALASTATAASKPSAIDVTLVGKGCGVVEGTFCGTGGGGSCLCLVPFWSFVGTGRLAPLGIFSFKGEYGEGFYPTDPVFDLDYTGPFTYFRELRLTLMTRNGDELVLHGRTEAQTPLDSALRRGETVSDTWSVESATGRLARLTGSGMYTLDGEIHGTYEDFFLTLAGNLAPA